MILRSSGAWESMIELLSHSERLLVFSIGNEYLELLHRGGRNFLQEAMDFDEEWDEYDLISACKAYVAIWPERTEHPQKHSCLRADKPKEAAGRFVDDSELVFELENRDESDGTASDSFDEESIESDDSETNVYTSDAG